MKRNKIKIIISGGGTGGHVFPAIAIANSIKQLEPKADILFVGAKGKMEMEKVPKAGFPIKGLWISGFHRKLTLRNLMFPLKLISSLLKSWRILRQFKPQVVVGVGGFASGPILEMAFRLGVPSLIQEQNSYAGLTNRLLAKKVSKICVAYPKMEQYFPKSKLIFTGNPVRNELKMKVRRKVACEHFGLDPEKRTIFVFGGSLGAKSINQAMVANRDLINHHSDDIQILWQAGKLYIDQFESSETAQLSNVKIRQFIDRMDLGYAIADVVICRAGALTIAELSLLGKAAVLVPSPNVAEDHQTKNAQAIVDINGGIMVEDAEANVKMIKQAIAILEEEVLKNTVEQQIQTIAKPNAAEDIAKEVIALIK